MKKTDKDSIVNEAIRLFKLNGFHRTTMAEIGQACGLLKGSIYHYFPSKEALALTAMEQIQSQFQDSVFRWAYDESIPPHSRLEKMTEAVEHFFSQSEGGCLMGNLTLELIDVLPDFAARIRSFFNAWTAAFAHVLEPRYGAVEAAALARDALAKTQGAVMLMRVYWDVDGLRRIGKEITGLLAE